MEVSATKVSERCPFAEEHVNFTLRKGEVVWLSGPSGVGKTTLASAVASLVTPREIRARLGVELSVSGSASVGALFQQSTLIDSLSVEANLCLALDAVGRPASEAKRFVEAVGLSYANDASKMATELSGGMARRASLALHLAQSKQVLVLDEPFVGLDDGAAAAVATELRRLKPQVAMLLISHQPHLAKGIADVQVTLTPRKIDAATPGRSRRAFEFRARLFVKFVDYVVHSMPLIAGAFVAAGMAVATLTADLLSRVDVQRHVDQVLDAEVMPLVDTLMKDAAPLVRAMTKAAVKGKATSMVATAMPKAKRLVYARGLASLFLLELGPLLTALLLAGRIGGSYAGQVATMQATSQNKLLQTLGVGPRAWSLKPALLAGLVAVPLLSVLGTTIALVIANHVGQHYLGDGTTSWYLTHLRDAAFPAWSWGFLDVLVWPPMHHLLKSATFALIILGVAELIARRDALTPRGVPGAITAAVVTAGLLIITADFAFSQLLLLKLQVTL